MTDEQEVALIGNLNIGDAAKRTGVSAKMIRHYEAIGLISPPARSESGYRVYGSEDVQTLTFIRRARDLGFSLADIAELLSLWRDRNRASKEVKSLALAHIEDLRKKASELAAMAETLQHLADSCDGNDRPDCPILGGLSVPQPPNA